MLKRFLKNWLFKEELKDLKLLTKEMKVQKVLSNELLQKFNINLRDIEEHVVHVAKQYIIEEYGECAVDVGMQYDPSWAVISIQGQKRDYIRFVDMKDADLREIGQFLKHFESRSREARFNVDLPHGIPKKHFRSFF